MTRTAETLPSYLKKYVVKQDYDAYTARDHAAWRFIMRQNRDFFKRSAVPVYLEGLDKTGIPIERIPRIEEMDQKLQRIGWGAVAVEGFIPSPAFLEFQARRILPIAVDMRTVDHIAYTPAPDIVHEAAGHAPIIADPEYAAYLQQYARMAQKAIASSEDNALYEAIRTLSDVKENPDISPTEIDRAEKHFAEVSKSVSYVSEAGQMARMAWWTVEYGLVGDLRSPRIYGAGLLSSVGESQHCLSDRVRKIPLSVDCVLQTYDITEPQPQLFVARDLTHLVDVLREFERTLAFVRGGVESVEKARRAGTVNTVVLDSRLEVSGVVDSFDAVNARLDFFGFKGPVQLSCRERELAGHGRGRHASGFSSPLGRWRAAPEVEPSRLTDQDLARAGVVAGQRARVEFLSGFAVEGLVRGWHRDPESGRLQLVTFSDCSVTQGVRRTFEPSWGQFDLAVGERATSVYSGPADREAYGEFDMGQASTQPGRTSPYTEDERRAFALYQRARELRTSGLKERSVIEAEMKSLLGELTRDFGDEWLLAVELLELAYLHLGAEPRDLPWMAPAFELLERRDRQPAIREVIAKGIALAPTA